LALFLPPYSAALPYLSGLTTFALNPFLKQSLKAFQLIQAGQWLLED
jgi:hypothetical protein